MKWDNITFFKEHEHHVKDKRFVKTWILINKLLQISIHALAISMTSRVHALLCLVNPKPTQIKNDSSHDIEHSKIMTWSKHFTHALQSVTYTWTLEINSITSMHSTKKHMIAYNPQNHL